MTMTEVRRDVGMLLLRAASTDASPDELRDVVDRLAALALREARCREHTEDFYASRWERLRTLVRSTDLDAPACAIMANGTATPDEPPTYPQRLAILTHERDEALRQLARATGGRS
jgi:hypothetical protein